MDFLQELFFSKKRQLVDYELKRIANNCISNPQLSENILYHLCLNENIAPTMEHSKRLRAYLCLLFAEGAGYEISDIVPLAVTVELLHNSTLIIDDIQDNGAIRCGKKALWKKAGLANALNASYFLGLFSQSYFATQKQKYGYYDYSQLFAETTDKLISGQQSDINAYDIENKNLDAYCEIAKGKTGALINLCIHFGCMPYVYNQQTSTLLKEFADLFACAYQILDDLSDLQKYMSANQAVLDSSNIFYFTSSTPMLSKQIVKESIPSIISLKQELQVKLNLSILNLKNAEMAEMDKFQLLVNNIFQ
jgi:geranylgeranyl pyrophosphate synthase